MLDSLERAREAERRFVADASHELRTPLTALRGNVAYLARHGATPELVADLERRRRAARAARRRPARALARGAAAPPARRRAPRRARARGAGADRASTPSAVDGARRPRRARARAREPGRERAPARPRARSRVTVRARRRPRARQRRRRGRRACTARGRARVRALLAGDGVAGSGLAIVRATAERHGGRAYVDGRALHDRAAALRKASETGRYTSRARNSRKDAREDLPHRSRPPV